MTMIKMEPVQNCQIIDKRYSIRKKKRSRGLETVQALGALGTLPEDQDSVFRTHSHL